MARFNCIPPVTGTIGPVCIYQMYGKYFLRTRSSLTGQRVKKDPAFRKTMQYAALLGKASRIASTVYAALSAHKKQHALYRKLTGEAMTWLKYEWAATDIIDYLLKQYGEPDIKLKREPAAVQLRTSYRRKTQRLKDRKGRPIKPIKEKKPSLALYMYQLNERAFRRRYNEGITTYTWAESMT
ncbi:hypothetical protein [Paraflavitalea speifideaquila]|uniref:hypothetical protein n=1 Tax=Paraflavitalea speifideaquila TaxID=3076558 RepID=UPI0028EF8DF0|nr:hypothetical protein [Paraflavitalea speifideiaquila]